MQILTDMNVPVFIEIEVEEQAEELRAYFKGLGAEISETRSDKGFEDDLHKIIGVCDACFRETNVKDVQGVRTSNYLFFATPQAKTADNFLIFMA